MSNPRLPVPLEEQIRQRAIELGLDVECFNLNRLLGVKPVRDLEIDIHWSDGIEHGKIDEIAHGKLWYFAKTRRGKWGKTSQSIEYEKAHLIQKHEAE